MNPDAQPQPQPQPLADQTCIPCRGGVPPLTRAKLSPLLPQIARWSVIDRDGRPHHLQRAFRFPDFKAALAFVDAIGAEAEAQGHHPDLELGWGRVAVSIHTHTIDGLVEADCILAARIDRIHDTHDSHDSHDTLDTHGNREITR